MEKLKGVEYIVDSKGRPKKVILDLKVYGQELEDILDIKAAREALAEDEFISLDEATEQLEKHHGIKMRPDSK